MPAPPYVPLSSMQSIPNIITSHMFLLQAWGRDPFTLHPNEILYDIARRNILTPSEHLSGLAFTPIQESDQVCVSFTIDLVSGAGNYVMGQTHESFVTSSMFPENLRHVLFSDAKRIALTRFRRFISSTHPLSDAVIEHFLDAERHHFSEFKDSPHPMYTVHITRITPFGDGYSFECTFLPYASAQMTITLTQHESSVPFLSPAPTQIATSREEESKNVHIHASDEYQYREEYVKNGLPF